MSSVKIGRFLCALCALAFLANTAHSAETPAAVKQYAFELQTLNLGDQVRKTGGVKVNVNDGMSEDELDAVNHALDELSASPVDADGYRALALSNGTQAKIGGFLVEGFVEDSVEGVQSLPLEFSVKETFSTAEAALVCKYAKAGNLFVASPTDPEKVATTGPGERAALLQAAQAGIRSRRMRMLWPNGSGRTLRRADCYSSSSSFFFCSSRRFLICIHSSSRFRSIGLRAVGVTGCRGRLNRLTEGCGRCRTGCRPDSPPLLELS